MVEADLSLIEYVMSMNSGSSYFQSLHPLLSRHDLAKAGGGKYFSGDYESLFVYLVIINKRKFRREHDVIPLSAKP